MLLARSWSLVDCGHFELIGALRTLCDSIWRLNHLQSFISKTVTLLAAFCLFSCRIGNFVKKRKIRFGDNDISVHFDLHEACDALFWWVFQTGFMLVSYHCMLFFYFSLYFMVLCCQQLNSKCIASAYGSILLAINAQATWICLPGSKVNPGPVTT